MNEQKFNKLKEQYINAAILNKKSLKTGSVRVTNKNAKIINNITNKINENEELKEKFYSEVLEYDNIYSKGSAAIDAIREGVLKEKSLKILNEILEIEDEEYKLLQFGIKTFLEKILPKLENN